MTLHPRLIQARSEKAGEGGEGEPPQGRSGEHSQDEGPGTGEVAFRHDGAEGRKHDDEAGDRRRGS